MKRPATLATKRDQLAGSGTGRIAEITASRADIDAI
jgi:hypothetical protein